jgi:hypothetical protein
MTDFKPELTPSIIAKKGNKKPLNYFCSNFDFDLFLKEGTAKVRKYGELDDKYTTFEQLLPNKKDYVIILIESEVNSGHWVCIMRNDNVFEYFDPYGYTYKKTLSFVSEYMNKHVLDNTLSDLGTLIKNMKPEQKLITNKTKFQNDQYLNDVATCGRWVLARIQSFMLINSTIEEFKKFIDNQCHLYDLPSDIIVVELIPVEKK